MEFKFYSCFFTFPCFIYKSEMFGAFKQLPQQKLIGAQSHFINSNTWKCKISLTSNFTLKKKISGLCCSLVSSVFQHLLRLSLFHGNKIQIHILSPMFFLLLHQLDSGFSLVSYSSTLPELLQIWCWIFSTNTNNPDCLNSMSQLLGIKLKKTD